jgi:hypothetical protein
VSKNLTNLRDVLLEPAAPSALGKGLNYAAAPAVLTIENFLRGAQKAVRPLPKEVAKGVRQETARNLKASR